MTVGLLVFPSRLGLLQRAVRKDLSALDRMPDGAAGADQERRTTLHDASQRSRGDEANTRAWSWMVAVPVCGFLAMSFLWASIRAAASERSVPASSSGLPVLPLTNLLFGFACAVVGSILVFVFLRTLPVVRSSRGLTRVAGLAFPCLCFPLRPLIHSALVLHSREWYLWQGYSQVSTFLVLGLVSVASAEMLQTWWGPASARPTDRLLILTVAAAAHIHTRTRHHLTAAASRGLCSDLEHLAYVAERDLSLPQRAPRAVRRGLRQDALRIAAVYRAHQQPLLLVRGPQDAEPLVASLLAAADALAAGDRAALLANAPDHVVERNLIRRFLSSRAWHGAVLMLCGALLPLIPALTHQPTVSSLRWTLIVAGALTWVAGNDMADRVGGSLEKALP
ncbi:hypothetical protein [Streptomyces sp. MBT62]|uniref:hypothetical protein n=1 Tax=Streptomyces sp. MBT62 TaxID=2800410 RepID=UPI00190B5F6B|nr:hypothetical protein [Streptomyces sp. MBT62]MBK3570014.1 hypothetical protein [Streptomyces sp. MBT62]